MLTARIVCAKCGQVNRAALPVPAGKGVRCGNRTCRTSLSFRDYVGCPECHRTISLNASPAYCKKCGLVVDDVPLLASDPPYDMPPQPEKSSWMRRTFDPTSEVAYLRDLQKIGAIQSERRAELERSRQAYETLKKEWDATALERSAKAEWSMVYSCSQISELGSISGSDFEHFVASLFLAMGYDVRMVSGGADQGADLIVSKAEKNQKTAIQAKRYKAAVGNAAVQELLGGMLYYGCEKGIVITSSTFTRRAQALASRDHRIALWDRERLADLHRRFLTRPPEFSMEEYKRLKKSMRALFPATLRRLRRSRRDTAK